jgi:ABC-type dipeptide/oligopeptide/nickel transport system permease component
VEYLVVWPGLGVLALRAVNVQDLPVLLGSVAVLGVGFFATEIGLDVLTRRTGVVTG